MKSRAALLACVAWALVAAAPAEAQGWMLPLANPSAEASAASPDGMSAVEIPGWTVTGALTVVAYGTPGEFPVAGDVTDVVASGQLFVGGPAPGLATASQTVPIPADWWLRLNDTAYPCGLEVIALLGGWQVDADSARIVVTILDGQSAELSSFTVGPVTAADRGGLTTLKQCLEIRTIPAGSRSVNMRLEMYGVDGPYNNAFADCIQLWIVCPDPVVPSTWGAIKSLLAW